MPWRSGQRIRQIARKTTFIKVTEQSMCRDIDLPDPKSLQGEVAIVN